MKTIKSNKYKRKRNYNELKKDKNFQEIKPDFSKYKRIKNPKDS